MDLDEIYSELRTTLQADDYRLTVDRDGDRYVFSIGVGPTACADCLVPEHVFEGIVVQVGQDAGLDIEADRVLVKYPRP